MNIQSAEIIHTYRQGQKYGRKPHCVWSNVLPSLRARIFSYTRNLQALRNSLKEFYYVNQQYPEEFEAKGNVGENETNSDG